MTAVVERLESDIALRELAAVATSWPERMFLERLRAIFGSDIPVEAYRKLRQALVSGQLVPPRLELVKTGLQGHMAGYDNARRAILVHPPLVSAAERDRGQAATLLLALIEEFGHHVDNLLRTEYSRVGGDAPRDEGAEFALREEKAIIQRQFAKAKEEQAAVQSWYDKRYGAPEQLLAELRRTLQESERRI